MKRIRINQLLIFTILILGIGFGFSSCKEKVDNYFEEMTILKKYIADNNITTQPRPSGLYYIETLVGTGDRVRVGLTAFVRYKGYLLNGTVFDQNLDKPEPFPFVVGYSNVINGWHEGIALMRVGGKAKLIIPSSLAYGYTGSDAGEGGVDIPPYSTIIFEVELVGVQ